MIISKSYSIINRENESFLVNIDNGDIYLINDVTLDVVTLCEKFETIDALCDYVFSKYANEGDYSKDELKLFVNNLIRNGIICE